MPLPIESADERTQPARVRELISRTIAFLIREYRRTGRIGNSVPKNTTDAVEQATAIAYSEARRRTGKKL